ncbi:hypothetical protein [Acidicapsa acidisoli]|uniref:hypothetical protein n=1 Tax=Acidicapsa acidisoli TaxID=1615681 RepID=UPI0021E00C03|nr:hypothetical protein [Acidicapsa acidisoli]
MATIADPTALPPTSSPRSIPWCYLLLDNLHEFATLAWYLVADGTLVEEVFSRVMKQLDTASFDDSDALTPYNLAREAIITQAVDVLAGRCREEEINFIQADSAYELPNLPRLAFLLRFVIRSSESAVARYLDVSPSRVRELVMDEIDYLSVRGPWSVLTNVRGADAI